MQVILHLGAHRTGTTSFQYFLRGNETALRRADIAHWGPERTRSGLFQGLVRRSDRLDPSIIETGSRSCGRMRIELDRLAQGGTKRLIVSEENMIGGLRQMLSAQRLYPDAAARLTRFAPAFAGYPLRIAISIRNYAAWWGSALAYAIPVGQAVPLPAAFDRMVTQPRRWRDVIRDVAATFPAAKICVWSFETMAGQTDRQVATALGTPLPFRPVEPSQWRHRSPTSDDLREVLTDRGEPLSAIPAGTDRWQPFDVHHRQAMRAQYQADLHWLRAGAEGIAEYHETQAQVPRMPSGMGLARQREGQTRDPAERGMEITR